MENIKNKKYQFYSVLLFIFAILINIYCIRIFYEDYDGNEISNLSKLTLNKIYSIKNENYLLFKSRIEDRNSHLKFGSLFSILFLILSYIIDYLSNFKINRRVSIVLEIILSGILILTAVFIRFSILIWTSWN